MNYRMIGFSLGRILFTEGILMGISLLVSLFYQDGAASYFIPAILLCLLIGGILGLRPPKNTAIYAKEGLITVALAWVFISAFGAIPFYLGGLGSLADCFFETVSGFTTTGASILVDVEIVPNGLLFWRSFTHWVGGMGVLVFVMAILPMSEGNGMHLMRAEVPGPAVEKLVSKMSDTAKILYGIYFVMTIVEILLLVAGKMPVFDAVIHSLGAAGTGGFSSKALSVGAYDNPYYDVVIGVFMLLFGINFNLYYFILIGRIRDFFRSEELRTYLGVVAVSVIFITINIFSLYGSVFQSLRHAFFQVSSIITTTGFATTDFNLWPPLSKAILVMLMFIGACAGSTGGGIKVARVVILAKAAFADMRKMLHPNAISTVRFEKKLQDEKTIRSVHLFLSVYLLVFCSSVLLLSFEGFDLVTTFTAVASCINNIGPGLEIVGPMGNFSEFSAFGKILLSFDMLVGRLEIFPMLLLFSPSVWKRRRKKIPKN